MLTAIISGLAIGCVYGLVAIGFSMVFRAMGLVNFAQGDLLMLGAFLGFSVLTWVPAMPYLLVLLLAAVGAGAFGFLLERFLLRPAVRRRASQIHLVLLTLGIGMVMSNGARVIWGANPVVYEIPLRNELVHIGGIAIPLPYFYIAGGMLLILLMLQHLFTRTWVGLTLRAVADNPQSAQLMGISVANASTTAFVIACMLGAAAGVFYAPLFYVSFDMGLIGIKAFAAAVAGGFGNLPGAIVGGLVIGVAEAVGGVLIGNQYQDSIAFGTMIVLLLIRPQGLLGKRVTV